MIEIVTHTGLSREVHIVGVAVQQCQKNEILSNFFPLEHFVCVSIFYIGRRAENIEGILAESALLSGNQSFPGSSNEQNFTDVSCA